MSEMAKKAREANKEKAQRLATPTKGSVDASGWSEPTMNTEAKTGLRPVSPRAYKRGGKVDGVHAKTHAGKKPRKSGGEVKKWVDAKINRNVKEANSEMGEPHVGALKHGGRTHKAGGGAGDDKNTASQDNQTTDAEYRKRLEAAQNGRKHGGRTHKMGGGLTDPRAAAAAMMSSAASRGNVPSSMMQFGGVKRGLLSPMPGRKSGGKAEKHDDVKEDKALIRKMVKPSARTGKSEGGGNYTGGTRPTGGRIARKSGGKAGKGKTNVNILIHAGAKPGMDGAAGPMGMPPRPPGAMPVPVPPAAAAPPPAGAPMSMPPPPMPAPGPQMGRKHGGRTPLKMKYGSGGGEGRLEKIKEYGLTPPK